MATKSGRQSTKRKTVSETEDSDAGTKSVKKIRSCTKTGCPTTAPICFVRATSTCCGNGYTSRWYHISAGEHFCNECFEYFYRSHKSGYDVYTSWKRIWSQYGKTDNGIRFFIADQMLPYWVQCNKCEKWRQVYRETNLTPHFLKSYVCTLVLKNETQEQACSVPEDFRIVWTKDPYTWAYHLQVSVFLKNAVYAPYVRNYFLDMVGISPSDTSFHKFPEGVTEVRRYMHPFQDSEDTSLAMSLPPHCMTEEEQLDFPDFSRNFLKAYLIIRNTIIVLWNLNVKKWVTKERCMSYLNMRGLSRVWLSEHVDRVLIFLMVKGYINCGMADIPKEIDFVPVYDQLQKHPVIIVGGGMAGLAAARQLTNLGVQVSVLEASNHIGGRAVDGDNNCFVYAGSHMLIGSHNNPVVVMCKQADMKLVEMSDQCVLLDETGSRVDDKVDKRMQFHFEAILDINKQLRREQEVDDSLLDRFNVLHEQFKDESGIRFSKLEESLLQFHMSNLEYACGSHLANVSSLHWDQNDEYPQFQGPPLRIQGCLSKILEKLAENIQIVKNSEVCAIDYREDNITVKCVSGEEYQAAKVIVCTPLSVLKNDKIAFTPKLPEYKKITLGCGLVEKIVLEFSNKFWGDITKESNMFGRVLTTAVTRGLFDVFYDISPAGGEKHVLVSYVTGDSVDVIKDKSDEQVVEMCLIVLQKLFKDVPFPVNQYVSRWYDKDNIQMSYTYIPTNCGAEAFDNMEKDVDGKLYFAGEATHKQFHQTITGAYMSGLREAEKVYRVLTSV